MQNISETISRYIRECSDIIHTKGHQIAKEYGLTYDQYHLLVYLNSLKSPPTISEISDKLNRAQNTISEKITRLEEKGLVNRIDDSTDRRVTRVIATELGIELISNIRRERSNRVTYLALSQMEKNDVENLLIFLEKLYNNLKREES